MTQALAWSHLTGARDGEQIACKNELCIYYERDRDIDGWKVFWDDDYKLIINWYNHNLKRTFKCLYKVLDLSRTCFHS